MKPPRNLRLTRTLRLLSRLSLQRPLLTSVVALGLAAACSTPRAAKEPPPAALARPACPVGASADSCFPSPLKAPPVVVGPGRIRALVWDREAPAQFATPSGFLILEISESGFKPVARGLCPEGSRPESLGQVASGRSAVLCRGTEPVAYVGTLLDSGVFEWRWKQTIALAQPAQKLEQVPLFAELGDRLALVYSASGEVGSATPPWALQLGPEKTAPVPLCAAHEACPIVALVVADGTLHVVFGGGTYKDLMVAVTGLTALADPVASAKLHPGELAEPCVSQGKDGKVTLQLPVVKQVAGETPDAPARREAQIATLEYEHAWLPHGPDVFPTELATCGPRGFRDDGAGDVPISLREGVRATFDQRWLLVYGLPEVAAESYLQQLFPKRGGAKAAYPGSVRVLRGADVMRSQP